MRNNIVRDLAKTHLIYDYQCKEGECEYLPNKPGFNFEEKNKAVQSTLC